MDGKDLSDCLGVNLHLFSAAFDVFGFSDFLDCLVEVLTNLLPIGLLGDNPGFIWNRSPARDHDGEVEDVSARDIRLIPTIRISHEFFSIHVRTAQDRQAIARVDLSCEVDSPFTYDFKFDGSALAAYHRAQPLLVRPYFSQALKLCPIPQKPVQVELPCDSGSQGSIARLICAEKVNVDAFAVFPEFKHDGRPATEVALCFHEIIPVEGSQCFKDGGMVLARESDVLKHHLR